MVENLEGYQDIIDEVKKRIVDQKVPTKYAKGLAILSVLWFEYKHGDALAGHFFNGALKHDTTFIDDLAAEAGATPGLHDGMSMMNSIVEKYSETYPVFKALLVGHDDLLVAIREMC